MSRLSFALWCSSSFLFALFLFLLGPKDSLSNYRGIEIFSGDSFTKTAANLYKDGIVRSSKAFALYGLISGSAHKIRPGNYILNSGSSTPAIMNVLISAGLLKTAEIVIPEGFTIKDIENRLYEKGILPRGAISNFNFKEVALSYPFFPPKEDFRLRPATDGQAPSAEKNISSLEGFMLPDTYIFFKNSPTATVIKKFLDNFETKAWPLLKDCEISPNLCNGYSYKKILVIASMLEKEAPDYKDRRLIAGIFENRLNEEFPLQIDSTIVYAKCGGAFATCDKTVLTLADLKIDSLYNSYIY